MITSRPRAQHGFGFLVPFTDAQEVKKVKEK